MMAVVALILDLCIKKANLPNGRSLQVFRTSSNFLAAFDTIADETLVPHIDIERSQHLGAGHYQRSRDRIDYANGFKPKINTFSTRFTFIYHRSCIGSGWQRVIPKL
jgi:hypothetical protein